jgi:hypothetical protein
MINSRKIVRIFLGSPGDLEDERRVAKSVVDEFNGLWADTTGYQVELVGWEETVSGFGRPQAIINRDLERCEHFVGMIWRRWGTPPDKGGTFTSGFEEELKRSITSRKEPGKPEISLFFKAIDADSQRDPGEQLKRVIALRDSIIAEKELYYETFATVPEFELKIRRCVTRYIQQLQASDTKELPSEGRSQSSGDSEQPKLPASTAPSKTALSDEGTKFIREFVAKTERGVDSEPINTIEVARFRLLGNIIGEPGNDQQSLGVHDANLIFISRSELELGRSEIVGMIRSGLEQYSYETAPLWFWVAAVDGFRRNVLGFFSVVGSSAQNVGALSAMRLISEPLPYESEEQRNYVLKHWLAPDAASPLKVGALAYLGDCGGDADIPAIKAELVRADYQTTDVAMEAILRIRSRESCDAAIHSLNELQPRSISAGLLNELFDNGSPIADDLLLQCLGHQSSGVRRRAVVLLKQRGALDLETAGRLVTDGDAAVRFEALGSLIDRGKVFSDDEVKKILVKPSTATGLAILSGRDEDGEAYWTRFQIERWRGMTVGELEKVADKGGILDRNASFVLAERQFSVHGAKLRDSIDDQFKSEFAKEVARMEENVFAVNSGTVETLKSLEEFLRKGLTREALDVVCRNCDPKDLGRVRKTLASGFVGYSETDIEYLRRFGKWEDIPLIVAAIERPSNQRYASLLSGVDDSRNRIVARAIYEMARSRLQDLLVLEMPSDLLSSLVAVCLDASFRGLNQNSISLLLSSGSDRVRKVSALKCIRALPKERVRRLLADYVSGGRQYYYNVVHWLDMGISVPRERGLAAAKKALARELRSWDR